MLDLQTLDDGHLAALTRALHESRFCQDPNDPVVWASPLVVDLHVSALAEQRRRDDDRGSLNDWDRWLEWSGRDEARTVVRRLRADARLLEMVIADPELLRQVLRPFKVNEESLQAMLDEAREEV